MNYRIKDLTGQRFNRLVVLEYTDERDRASVVWICKCDCGNVKKVASVNLIHRYTQSCGCLHVERSTVANKKKAKHGMSNTKIYRLYHGMFSRCYLKNGEDYYLYGGRGIKVDDRWKGPFGFKNFYADMGAEYDRRKATGERFSLDRIDVNGNYSPSNRRWATLSQQA